MQQKEVQHTGFPTWFWDRLPEVRQKPLDPKLADPKCWFFGRGAHIPILVFLQNKKMKTARATRFKREIKKETVEDGEKPAKCKGRQ